MKAYLITIAIGMFIGANVSAKPVGTITFGVPTQKVSPADDKSPRLVYIELPVTITNTSSESITFSTNGAPLFNEYVQLKTTSKHWSDITPKGMCGVGITERTLSPGGSFDTGMWIQSEYGGRAYRLDLPIYKLNSSRKVRVKIKSQTIILPKIKG